MLNPIQQEPFTPERLLGIAVAKLEAAKGLPPSDSYDLRREADNAILAAKWMEDKGWTGLPVVGPFANWLPKSGDRVRLCVGAKIISTSDRLCRTIKRSYVIKVNRVSKGYVFDDGALQVIQPEVHWAGSGGYWCWTSIFNVRPTSA